MKKDKLRFISNMPMSYPCGRCTKEILEGDQVYITVSLDTLLTSFTHPVCPKEN